MIGRECRLAATGAIAQEPSGTAYRTPLMTPSSKPVAGLNRTEAPSRDDQPACSKRRTVKRTSGAVVEIFAPKVSPGAMDMGSV